MTSALFRLAHPPRMPAHYHTQVQRLNLPPARKFQEYLLQLGNWSIDGEEYVTNCITTVKETIQLPEYDFSEAGIKKVSPLLALFKEITGAASFMQVDQMLLVNREFNKNFCGTLEEKWSVDAAQSFNTIPDISKREEKIVAAQRWTHNCFCALNSLIEWKELYPLSNDCVNDFLQITLSQFYDCAHALNEKKLKVMIERMARDPIDFQRILARVAKKAEKDPSSLSWLEKDYDDFTQVYGNHRMNYLLKMNKKASLLKKCLWAGYLLEKLGMPILESPHLFEETFRE